MKCWEWLLSRLPPAVHTRSLKPTSFLLYIFHYSINCNAYQSLRRELHMLRQQSIFLSKFPTTAWRYDISKWGQGCRDSIASLQAICREVLDDRSAQSRYRWWSQEWGDDPPELGLGVSGLRISSPPSASSSLGRGDWPGRCRFKSPRGQGNGRPEKKLSNISTILTS